MITIKNTNKKYSDYQDGEYYIGLSWDYCYQIFLNDRKIGRIFLSEMTNGSIFIEWVDLNSSERGKGYFRQVLALLEREFSGKSIEAEASESYCPMYKHLGFKVTAFDDLREMYSITKEIAK